MNKRRGFFTILVAVLLVATLLLFLISFRVRLNEAAIVFTFRRAAPHAITKPGLYWKLPYPIQTVMKFDRRIHIYEGKFQEYLTRDQHNLIVAVAVGWWDITLLTCQVWSQHEISKRLLGVIRTALWHRVRYAHPKSRTNYTDTAAV